VKPTDYQKRQDFAETLLALIAADPAYLNKICFTDEVTFHISGRVHRHNVRVLGNEKSLCKALPLLVVCGLQSVHYLNFGKPVCSHFHLPFDGETSDFGNRPNL
jgi:hypothetical protein